MSHPSSSNVSGQTSNPGEHTEQTGLTGAHTGQHGENPVRAARQSAEVPPSGAVVPRWKRKSTLIMLAVLSALAVFGSTTQTWVHVRLAQGVVQQADLDVPGSKAATAVTALALVALAGALAASIAGRFSRLAAAVIIALSAAGIMASAVAVLADPQASATGPVGAATGVVGVPSQAATTVFPVLAIAAAAVLALAAVLIAWAGRGWAQRTKYDPASPSLRSAAGSAAGLPAGSGTGGSGDPSGIHGAASDFTAHDSSTAGSTGSGLIASGSTNSELATHQPVANGSAGAEPLDDIDSWDQLSRGNDPTS